MFAGENMTTNGGIGGWGGGGGIVRILHHFSARQLVDAYDYCTCAMNCHHKNETFVRKFISASIFVSLSSALLWLGQDRIMKELTF